MEMGPCTLKLDLKRVALCFPLDFSWDEKNKGRSPIFNQLGLLLSLCPWTRLISKLYRTPPVDLRQRSSRAVDSKWDHQELSDVRMYGGRG